MDPLKYLPEAIAYLESQGKTIQPLEQWLYDGENMYYLFNQYLFQIIMYEFPHFGWANPVPKLVKKFENGPL